MLKGSRAEMSSLDVYLSIFSKKLKTFCNLATQASMLILKIYGKITLLKPGALNKGET